MTRHELSRDLDQTETMAFEAMGYIPRGSFYYKWCCQLLAREIEAWKYLKLRDRLTKFHTQ